MEKRRTVTHVGNFPASKEGGKKEESQHSGNHDSPQTHAERKVGIGMAWGKSAAQTVPKEGWQGKFPPEGWEPWGEVGVPSCSVCLSISLIMQTKAALSITANPINWRQGCHHPRRGLP